MNERMNKLNKSIEKELLSVKVPVEIHETKTMYLIYIRLCFSQYVPI